MGRPGGWRARYRDDWTLRRKGLAALALPMVVLVGVALSLSVLSSARDRDLATERNALIVQRDATAVEGRAVTAVSDVRELFLAPGPSTVTPAGSVTVASDELRSSLDTLARGVATLGRDTPARAALVRVRAAVAGELATLATVGAAGSPGSPAAEQLLEGRAAAALADLRDGVDGLVSAAGARAAASGGAVSRADGWLEVVLVAGGSLGLVGMAVAVAVTNQSVARRVDRLREAVDLLERAEPLDDLPAGSDEIGRVAAGLARAASLLNEQRQVLEESRSFMEALLERSPVVAWRIDLDTGDIAYVSPNCSDLLGLDTTEASSSYQAVTDRLDHEDVEVVRATIERIGRTGTRATFGVRYHHPDGRPRSFRVDILPVGRQPDGSNALCFYTDVTEVRAARERLLEQKNLLEAVLDASPDIYVVRDLDLHVIDVHGAVQRLLGWDRHQYAEHGENVDVLVGEDRTRFLDTLVAVGSARAGVTELRFEVVDRDGARHVFDMLVSPVRDHEGNVIGTLTASRDITARLALEAELDRARVEAERANQAKSEFLSRMSHELRTPLNAILGFTQLLELDELPGEQAEQLAHIRRAGTHLLSLINEVLDVTRIEAGKLELTLEPVEVGSAVREAVDLLAPLSDARELTVSVEVEPGLPPVVADRTRLAQVLLNLVTNAVKYNRPGGGVTVLATVAAATTAGVPCGSVRIAVADTGPGIAPHLVDRLFVPFDRLGAEQTGVEGTGMGLTLTRALTLSMGGAIDVASEPGVGSTFAVTFPAAGSAAATDTAPGRPLVDATDPTAVPAVGSGAPAPPAGATDTGDTPVADADGGRSRQVTVLYVEDNASNVELMAEVLRRHGGTRLIVAADGRTGLDLAARHCPDLVLLDLHLPDLTGEEVLDRLRRSPVTAGVTVVAVSADATRAQIDRMLALGAATYVTKPFDVSVIGRLVDDCRAPTRPPPARR